MTDELMYEPDSDALGYCTYDGKLLYSFPCKTPFRTGHTVTKNEWHRGPEESPWIMAATGGFIGGAFSTTLYIRCADRYDKLCFKYVSSVSPSIPNETADFTLYELDLESPEWPTLPPTSFGSIHWSVDDALNGTEWCIDISGISTTWLAMQVSDIDNHGDPSSRNFVAPNVALTDDCDECSGLLNP